MRSSKRCPRSSAPPKRVMHAYLYLRCIFITTMHIYNTTLFCTPQADEVCLHLLACPVPQCNTIMALLSSAECIFCACREREPCSIITHRVKGTPKNTHAISVSILEDLRAHLWQIGGNIGASHLSVRELTAPPPQEKHEGIKRGSSLRGVVTSSLPICCWYTKYSTVHKAT